MIRKHETSPTHENRYSIQTDQGCPLFWKRNKGMINSAEFRCDQQISDVFWIREEYGRKFRIGFTIPGHTDCSLVSGGEVGNIKAAEFKCGHIGDTFHVNGWNERNGETFI